MHLALSDATRDCSPFRAFRVYAVRRDANGAGVRLRQLQDQEHRAGYAKGSKRRHGDGRVAGFRVQPGQKKRNAGPHGNEVQGWPRHRVDALQRHQNTILPDGGIIALGVREQRFLRFGRRLQMVEGDAQLIHVANGRR